jgi:hypothetical protein
MVGFSSAFSALRMCSFMVLLRQSSPATPTVTVAPPTLPSALSSVPTACAVPSTRVLSQR